MLTINFETVYKKSGKLAPNDYQVSPLGPLPETMKRVWYIEQNYSKRVRTYNSLKAAVDDIYKVAENLEESVGCLDEWLAYLSENPDA